ncbi:F1F0-ATPase inhibitor-like protein [Rhynchospora pubera]|uniref:F1F0-ATPase inhibitor-like protein n=1 Tax=Rhynchospora pubera TaxID=906938 RepID=A0AAV8GIQ9_9POAL|nr:F1F0-ATPase inhibitor-like protein [Rhynchospora pubera]
MAMRSVIGGMRRLGGSQSEVTCGSRVSVRLFSDDKGKVLSEEERAKENVYIKKWEKERLEKQKKKAEAEKEKSDKTPDGSKKE